MAIIGEYKSELIQYKVTGADKLSGKAEVRTGGDPHDKGLASTLLATELARTNCTED